MTNIEKINFLLDKVENKFKSTITENFTDSLRQENIERTKRLFNDLQLQKKHPDFKSIFHYTAMNLAGIGLKNENFAEIREGKYVQIIAISHDINPSGKKIIKNASLGYYGKAEKLDEKEKHKIIEFVLRWRYEKTFQHSDYYQQLLSKLH